MPSNLFPALVELNNKIQALDQRVIINTILSRPEFKKLIIQLNTKGQPTSQLFELNVDSDGVQLSSIGGNYSPYTLENASPPKKGASKINLFDTGDYYRTYRVEFPSLAADYFNILHNPQKDDDNLEDDWGDKIAGLTSGNLEIIAEKITPLMVELTLKMVGV